MAKRGDLDRRIQRRETVPSRTESPIGRHYVVRDGYCPTERSLGAELPLRQTGGRRLLSVPATPVADRLGRPGAPGLICSQVHLIHPRFEVLVSQSQAGFQWSVARSTIPSRPSQHDRAFSVGKASPLEQAGSVGRNDHATIFRGDPAVAWLFLEIVPRNHPTENERIEVV